VIGKREEPKQEFVSVPKEIQFHEPYKGCIELIVGSHVLGYQKFPENWYFKHFSEHPETKDYIIDCVLVPTKRESLKAGDWAFRANTDTIRCVNCLDSYCLIINETEHVFCSNDSVMTGSEEFSDWFKVVPRNEAMKNES
jgi:hypothetical protein